MVYTDDSRRAWQKIRDGLDKTIERRDQAILRGWATLWDDLESEITAAVNDMVMSAKNGTLSAAKAAKNRRLLDAIKVAERGIGENLRALSNGAVADLPGMLSDAVSGYEKLLGTMLPPDPGGVVKFGRVDPRQVNTILARSTEQITSLHWALSAEATEAMKSALVRGVAVGDNPRRVAEKMVADTRGVFEGGAARARTIARTEILDAHRAAGLETWRANSDILRGWRWVASLGPRTCQGCWGMHGSIHDLSEFGPDGHQCCRCTGVPVTKSWADLGFDVEEPKDQFPDAKEAFDRLADADQRRILGGDRYRAYRSGDFPLDQWATRRSNQGWRDSVVPNRAVRVDGASYNAAFTMAPAVRVEVDRALAAINKVHGSNSAVFDLHQVSAADLKKAPGLGGYYAPRQSRIAVNTASDSLAHNVCHEFGHMMDYQVLNSQFTAGTASKAPEWSEFFKTVRGSTAYKSLQGLRSTAPKFVKYSSQKNELWARAYAQWVAERSGDKVLLDAITSHRGLNEVMKHSQWDKDDFAPISAAIDKIMGGLLK